MKVITVATPGGLDNLKAVERAMPEPGPHEVVVRWHATSLNYHDYLVAIGGIPVPDGRIPMSDGAGVIESVGSEVRQWKAGDKVMSLFFPKWLHGGPTYANTKGISGETVDGYACEYSVLPAEAITGIPAGYSFAEAATLPCAAVTAWRALMVDGHLQAGQSVLIEGSGGMSIFALQIAKAAGAKVYATTSSNEKAEVLKSMGAEAVINYKEDENWGKTILKMTGGVDHVLDVGGNATFKQSVEAARVGGHVCLIGILGGPKGSVLFPKLFFKHLKLSGLAVGNRDMQNDMIRSIDISGWKPVVDKSFGLDDLKGAFEYQASGQHFGKIVVEW
ncbi:MAG: NAD(P)-dependent alcohol dehydrogenase [Bacteroidota bacterium]